MKKNIFVRFWFHSEKVGKNMDAADDTVNVDDTNDVTNDGEANDDANNADTNDEDSPTENFNFGAILLTDTGKIG